MVKRQAHSLNQSRLYSIGSKARLAEILGLPSRKALEALIGRGDKGNYETFAKDDRHIECPIGLMKDCHKRLAALLSRIALPDYVHSQKRRSYVTNARAHARGVAVVKTDITQYFPSTKFSHVQRLFSEDMKCPPDVAWYLTKLCTIGGHIPTGSYFSNPLSFLANRPLFDDIHGYARQKGCAMTLVQDDIVISGPGASRALLNKVLMMIRRWGLLASRKPKKTKTYSAGATKIVTGVVIKGSSITLPNRRHRLMSDAFRRARSARSVAERQEAILELRGRINEADQIDPAAVHPQFRRLAKR